MLFGLNLTAQQMERTKVFISYSHKDKRFLDELQKYLEHFQRNQMVGIWDDQQIKAGSRWFDEIARALAVTRVAILLVSADFLASDFIATYELPPLLAAAESGDVIMLPIIIRPCAFDDTPLKNFQLEDAPQKPLSLLTKARREQVWTRTAKLVVDVLASYQ